MLPIWAEIILAWLALGGILIALGVSNWSRKYIKSILDKQAQDAKEALDKKSKIDELDLRSKDLRSINNYYFRSN